MRINNIPVRWVGQRYGGNYAPAYPGEHVMEFFSIDHAAEELRSDRLGCPGDTILLWRTDVHDSQAEAHSRTLSDAAEADRLLTLGPRGGVKVERV